MTDVINFLKENSAGALATINENMPNVRPFQFMLEDKGKLYFCTSNKKNVFKELQANPYAAFTCFGSDTKYLRINGKVRFDKDVNMKNNVINSNELVKSIYKSASNPDFELFYFENGRMFLSDLLGNPTKEYKINNIL